ncbi:hypothetical protein GT348_07385 [Aristophania vespae]|uniref:TonB C-terminal domain-containing protein n=1 Tax=Aristophania vespae TaxID=2697033 RepID=A0A6P1NHS8_9PROT|nr:energy transducer TonB [Aristophania vespae]QHI96084.1 hypothetical protein GT348_07385 [Aristophania vespae]
MTHKKPTKEKKTKHSSQAKQNSHSQSQNNEGKEGQSNGSAKSAAPNPGDHSAGAQPINNVQPEYPLSAQEQSREGNVTAVCDILANGKPAHCKILKVRGGHDFAESAMDFLENSPVRYQPAVVNGQAVIEHNHVLHIDFVLTDGMD